MLKCNRPADVPDKPHWAVLVFYTTSYAEYLVFLDRREWEEQIRLLHGQNKRFAAIEVASKAQISTEVKIK